jgi:ubiquinone/menaquinone biosynthesis C-methylase UbiE
MEHDLDETRAAWTHIAAGYDEHVTPTHMWLANQGLKRVGLQAGMTFLDVACGSGALSIPAARMGAKVTSTDLSPGMVEMLNARATREGLSLEARVMDGQALDLDDDSFDVSGSQWGVMLFPDLPKGLREMVRVTKPGGKVLLHCYGPPPQVEFLGFFIRGIQAVKPAFDGLPSDPVPLPFQVADPKKLRQRYIDAGIKDVTVETITETLQFGTGRQLWDWVVNSNPVPRMILGSLEVTEDQETVIRDRLEELVRERAGSADVAKLTNPVHIAIGVV